MDLLKRLGLPAVSSNELKKALTHSSYRENGKDNSRYIFIGMFETKGIAARILYQYKSGKGTQLQQSLGNIFRNERLHYLFDKWKMEKFIRVGQDFVVEKHKHIFVYGLLGFLIEHYDIKSLRQFLLRHFITDRVLLEHDSQRFNSKLILQNLIIQQYGTKPQFQVDFSDGNYNSSIKVGDKTITTHSSKSKNYAVKKSIEKALKGKSNSSTLQPFNPFTHS